MCDSYKKCDDCLFDDMCFNDSISCLPDNADEIVDKWVKEHPIKTYLQDFLEKFPNASRRENGAPKICTRYIYPELANDCCGKCFDCWNQEIKEKKQ